MDKKCSSRVLKAVPAAPASRPVAAAPSQSASGRWPSRTYPAAAGQAASRMAAPDPVAVATAALDAERAALAAERARMEQAGVFLQTCASALAAARDDVLAGAEHELLDLVMKIARLVIQEEVTQRPELIVSQVQSALTRVKEDGVVIVRVHPRMMDPLREAAPRLIATGSRLHFESDASIEPGGCLVETPQRIVDARLAGQMAVIDGALRREVSEDP